MILYFLNNSDLKLRMHVHLGKFIKCPVQTKHSQMVIKECTEVVLQIESENC